MKGVVVYDTYFGNTKMVAEAIAEQIRADGHEAEVRNVREKYPSPPAGDFMFIGGPNRMYHLSRKTRKFVKKVDVATWKDKPVVIYATVSTPPGENATEKQKEDAQRIIFAAAPEVRDMARARGLNVNEDVLLAYVRPDTMKGPLEKGQIEHVKEWTHNYLLKIKK